MKPLEHLTILDLSRVLACPFASMILAELGARVIKIERPGSGDETRSFEPQLAVDSAYYFACNRSKESITRQPALRRWQAGDPRAVRRKADVLVENFPVGTLDGMALTTHPFLPYLTQVDLRGRGAGFGLDRALRAQERLRTVFQAMGGIMSLTGERGGGPVKPGLAVRGSHLGPVGRP